MANIITLRNRAQFYLCAVGEHNYANEIKECCMKLCINISQLTRTEFYDAYISLCPDIVNFILSCGLPHENSENTLLRLLNFPAPDIIYMIKI